MKKKKLKPLRLKKLKIASFTIKGGANTDESIWLQSCDGLCQDTNMGCNSNDCGSNDCPSQYIQCNELL
ncbi:hypothetical protein [Ascidiimonas sp. W6]|uniref:hypothetical protein n=1 Tax=Ascidiimonas meishanensis TaxID=3128903 RepID=UPI0030ECE213